MITTRLHWSRDGAGEPLVLLHGVGSTHDDFATLRVSLCAEYDVLAADLPGHGRSSALDGTPTVDAITDAVEADLDALGLGRVHVLGNSLGARVGLELARRHRAWSVVAIAPPGLNAPVERAWQGLLLGTARVVLRTGRAWIEPLSRRRPGRAVLLGGLRAWPWRASRAEALAVRDGLADADAFWTTLWHAVLADVPTGLDDVDCPVVLAQGVLDGVAAGQTVRYLLAVPGARFRPLAAAGHAPQSDRPGAIVRLLREARSAA
ncbi:alpha/beta fold hydrolase [Actinomycetospora sp. CA-101289]|uniref:alpha/beta fold hydrolase n=1 Tax=Actinomycetospora sp. CA-101289 TaxID=3239893 RepID=UPI003D9957B3